MNNYTKYLDRPMTSISDETIQHFNSSEINENHILDINQHHKIADTGYLPDEVGYATLSDGTAYMANHIVMPDVTIDMIIWWFVWHGLDPERYCLWNKEEHFDLVIDHSARERLTDMDVPLAERIYNVQHIVNENVGLGPQNIRIHFEDPLNTGFSEEQVANRQNYIAIANGDGAVMQHFFRTLETGGIELRTRFWLGWQIDTSTQTPYKLKNIANIPKAVPRMLGQHNIREMTHLASILPELYCEFGHQDLI